MSGIWTVWRARQGGQLASADIDGLPPKLAPEKVSIEATIVALMAQIKELAEQIDSYTTAADKYFGLAGSLSVAALAVAARGENALRLADVLLIAAPIALTFVLHYVCQLWTERAARSGMKRALENRVCELSPGGAVQLETILMKAVSQKRLSVQMSMIVYAGVVASTFLIGARHAFVEGRAVGVGFCVAGVVMGMTLLASVLEMRGAEERAYECTRGGLQIARLP